MSRTVILPDVGAPIVVETELTFRHPVNQHALAYWRQKKANRVDPSPADLDPLEMRGFGLHVGLVDVLTGADGRPAFRIRTAGAALENVFGKVGARTLSELPEYFPVRWHSLFLMVLGGREPVRATTQVTFEGRGNLTAEALLAPASDDGTNVAMLFVSVAFWTELDTPKR